MNETKRYYPSDMQLNLGQPRVVFTEHPNGHLCMYEDVELTVKRNKELEQRNKELEAELKRLREHVDSLSCGVSREAWHDTAWSLLQSRAIEDGEIMKVNIHTIRTVFNATYDALAGSALTKPNPAQEMPSELIEWANSWQEDDSDMPAYLIGYNDMAHFVKSQLEKMKGGV
jgi:hypothetical protein